MTTTTRNEAAERLRKTLAADGWKDTDLDLALAAERRATVERIRAALGDPLNDPTLVLRPSRVRAILDAEASR